MARIFISYAPADRDRAQWLYEQLKGQGHEPWLDVACLVAGQERTKTVHEEIWRSDFFVACLSKHAGKTEGDHQSEWNDALNYGRRKPEGEIYFIPVRLEDCDPPDCMKGWQWVDLFKPEGFNRLNRSIQKGMANRRQSQVVKDSPIYIPFVIVAMTRTQADELYARTAFDSTTVTPRQREQFIKLSTALEAQGMPDWLNCYGDCPEDWKPHSTFLVPPETSWTIEETVDNVINSVNKKNNAQFQIAPYFLSEDFFHPDDVVRYRTGEELRRLGGIVIVDSISIFHPDLYDMFRNSGISHDERISIIVLSPTNFRTTQVHRLIEETFRKDTERLFIRFNQGWDQFCEISATDLLTLQRWLFARLPKAAADAQNPRPHPDHVRMLQENVRRVPRGIDKFFSGQGGK